MVLQVVSGLYLSKIQDIFLLFVVPAGMAVTVKIHNVELK